MIVSPAISKGNKYEWDWANWYKQMKTNEFQGCNCLIKPVEIVASGHFISSRNLSFQGRRYIVHSLLPIMMVMIFNCPQKKTVRCNGLMWWVPRRYCDALECVTSWQLFPRTTPGAREFRLLSFCSFLSSSSCCFVIIIIFFYHFVIFFCIVFAVFSTALSLCEPFFSHFFLTFLWLSFFY